jgi:YegS/Rv2252/BmrU family lipid kinase
MTDRIAVVAHQRKSLDGGLPELRRMLADAGVDDPIWFEVSKSKKAPKRVRRAVEEGAEKVLVWGGDGMVQRCIDALAGVDEPPAIAILPAGTANLLASSLDVPADLEEAVRIALGGRVRRIDAGTVNGERFAVMSGVGFDAEMIDGADRSAKGKLGRLAYVRTGVGAMRIEPTKLRVDIDGTKWFSGAASCVLVGNVGVASGGLVVFNDAEIDDGVLEVAVVTAEGAAQWLRVLGRAARKKADRSQFVHTTRARTVDVRLEGKRLYELDGGSRTKVKRLRYAVEPGAVRVMVPA